MNFWKAIGFAVVIWIAGFVWGMVVFMTPAMKDAASIAYVSKYPWISFPLLILFPVLSYVLTKFCLRAEGQTGSNGMRVGLVFGGECGAGFIGAGAGI